MSIRVADVRHIANLAQLDLEPDELERFTAQLADILRHVQTLEEMAAEPDAPRAGTLAAPPAGTLAAPLRTDTPGTDPLVYPPERFAPDWRDGFFTLPRLTAQTSPAEPAADRRSTGVVVEDEP